MLKWEMRHMEHNNRIGLLFIVMGLVIGWLQGAHAQSQSPDRLVVALHVTIPSSWFDPVETPAQITPFGILYALHDAVVRPLPGERMAPALAASGPKVQTGERMNSNYVRDYGSITVIPLLPRMSSLVLHATKAQGRKNYRQRSSVSRWLIR